MYLTFSDKPTGWEEPSPPTQRRNIPNYDDGTSLWSAQSVRIFISIYSYFFSNRSIYVFKMIQSIFTEL